MNSGSFHHLFTAKQGDMYDIRNCYNIFQFDKKKIGVRQVIGISIVYTLSYTGVKKQSVDIENIFKKLTAVILPSLPMYNLMPTLKMVIFIKAMRTIN